MTKRKGGYADVLALECFRRALDYCQGREVGIGFFAPFIRNVEDGSEIVAMHDEFIPEEDEDRRVRKMRFLRERDREIPRGGLSARVCVDLWEEETSHEAFRGKLVEMTEAMIASCRAETAESSLRSRFAEVEESTGLDGNEMRLLTTMWLLQTRRLFSISGSGLEGEGCGTRDLVAYAGISRERMKAALRKSGKLCRYGILSTTNRLSIQSGIMYFLDGTDDEPLLNSFYVKDKESVLPIGFFGDLAENNVSMLEKLIEKRGKGVNILFYGAPGTGKTSFARALAKATHRDCYQIVQRPKDQNGEYRDDSREIRYGALGMCDDRVDPYQSVIVIDEADSLLSASNGKGLLNDILDKNKTPAIWIMNADPEKMDRSNLRRFDYSIEFKPLTKEQRFIVWKNAAKEAGLWRRLMPSAIKALCETYPVNIGIAARAFQNAADMGVAGGEECRNVVEKLLERHMELSGLEKEKKNKELPRIAKNYSLKGLNVKSRLPLEKVLQSVRRFLDKDAKGRDPDAPRMNILLSGAPGSGKTEFVKYLASELDVPLVVKKASDMLDCYVGETEKHIAKAFAEARDAGAILFFDEVDSFLDNRQNAVRGFEKTKVNEVLLQMENFGGVFIGSTNFANSLDPAVARRFTFKIELDYLDREGKRHFFESFFGGKLSEEDGEALDSIEKLTPGDFRTVRQQLYYLGETVTNADRIAALEEEVRAKGDAKRDEIGF